MKIAPRSVLIAAWSCGWCGCIGRRSGEWWYSDLTLPAAERSATPPHGIFFGSDAAKAGLKLLNAAPAISGAEALFPLIDILIVNETELASYAKLEREPVDLAGISGAARRLLSRAGQCVVVTLGAAGVALVTPEDAVSVPGRAVEVVDTTGAGDCFCGVLAALLSEAAALPDALANANAAAALAVGHAGAATSMPTRLELDAFLIG